MGRPVTLSKGDKTVDIKCEDVWREISNYLDDTVDPTLQAIMTRHFSECRECKSVLDGMRNVVALYGNERLFEPVGDFHRRLHNWLTNKVEGPKGSWWGWVAAIGFAGAVAASVALVAAFHQLPPQARANMSQPAQQVPQRLVAVVDSGKLFHNPDCPLMHGKYRMVTPQEAIREGYTPCTRCLGEDLRHAESATPDVELGENGGQMSGARRDPLPAANR